MGEHIHHPAVMESRVLVLCVLALAMGTSAQNQTADTDSRGSRYLNLFNVVKFSNSACTGNNNLNGTCYTADECTKLEGSSAGTCASGFGVCCTFSLSCGSMTSQNSTYAIMNSYNTVPDPSACSYKICKTTADVVKLRIDLTTFNIAQPYRGIAPYNNPAAQGLLDAAPIIGDCLTDTFTVTSPNHPTPPVICGLNSGQHMYVDASDACNVLTFNIDQLNTGTARKWYLEINQLTKEMNLDTTHNCLQYHTGTSGTFFNFNYDSSVTTNTVPSATAPGTNTHLSMQEYDICFRREEGYCKLCFSTPTTTSFGMGYSKAAAAPQAAVDADCTGVPGVAGDYIEVQNLHAVPTPTTIVTRTCGAIFSSASAATAAATACTAHTPFKWGVHFDGGEALDDQSASPAASQDTGENVNGHIGFYMQWFQVAC